MYKPTFWIIAMLILALLSLVPYAFAGNDATVEKVQTERVVLEVKNMTCISCVVTVKKSLTKLGGVKEAKVTLNPSEAVVIFDPSRIKVEELIKATTEAGYPSSVKQKKDR